MQDYESRLKVPIHGNSHSILYTKSGQVISTGGYDRIVIGKRGPYVEFTTLDHDILNIPDDQKWRLFSDKVYYVEYRTKIDNVKVYYQLKPVDYADYQVDKYYISPFDLYESGSKLIDELPKKDKYETTSD